MILHYTCPSCAGDMNFDADTGKLTCQSCGRQDTIENYPEELIKTTFEDSETNEYHCNNCGAVLITLAETTATNCSFCQSAVVIADRLSGSLAPSKVIPFTISEKEAVKAFKKWCRRGWLMPKDFMMSERVKTITGMYVPFWLYDINSQAKVKAVGTVVRTYSKGDYNYTETSYFDVMREINLNYSKIPADASEKMNDELMDKIEPFPFHELKDFKTPYLAGYIAEKYNYTDKEMLPRIEKRVQEYADKYIASELSNYSTVSYKQKNVNIKQKNSAYVLLPVWMIYHDYNNSEYIFAMNGHTGKVVGKPPISKGKAAAWFGGIAAGTFIILKAIATLIGEGYL
ncbi:MULTISPECIES: TFIIB-type zinc ribbon-containing protein [Bacillales]|uniref:TFIIB-type zinc ribbon-containing protein n=1 Tax=Lysinibacillus louembei TaxID=1470088 RepID=A0ABZ0S3K6_9BACI|nr:MULTISPECIES: TFIIB-type zinc ribbon-containing protein [Bacillales]MCT6923926.1 TFIIB-type zinc ribbon-containing protein [Metasolibacillus sp.]MCT6940464.1 TFIIB-type zinc ribbon-containing protein [Metasolibacillus sp.]WPK13683.1 TFIIB-type zinc ribbon-containing protein [Lysinibacillus louembei]